MAAEPAGGAAIGCGWRRPHAGERRASAGTTPAPPDGGGSRAARAPGGYAHRHAATGAASDTPPSRQAVSRGVLGRRARATIAAEPLRRIPVVRRDILRRVQQEPRLSSQGATEAQNGLPRSPSSSRPSSPIPSSRGRSRVPAGKFRDQKRASHSAAESGAGKGTVPALRGSPDLAERLPGCLVSSDQRRGLPQESPSLRIRFEVRRPHPTHQLRVH